MKKQVIWGLLAVLLLCVLPGVRGQAREGSFQCMEAAEAVYYYVEQDDSVAVIEAVAKKKTLAIPAQIDGRRVASLGMQKEDGSHYYFSLKGEVKRLVIPDCVEELVDPELASTLQTIRLGAGTRVIWKEGCFLNDERLKAIEVDGRNPYYKSVDGVLYSRDGSVLYAFPMRKSCKKYVLPAATREIFAYAFYNTYVQRVVMNKKLRVVGAHAFHYSNLQALSLPSKLRTIGDYAFMYTWIKGTVEIPSGVQSVGTGAFLSCDDVTEWRILGRQTELSDCAVGYKIYRSSEYGKNGQAIRVKSVKAPLLSVPAGSKAISYAAKSGLRYTVMDGDAAGENGTSGNKTATNGKTGTSGNKTATNGKAGTKGNKTATNGKAGTNGNKTATNGKAGTNGNKTATSGKSGAGSISRYHKTTRRLTFREESKERTMPRIVRDWKSENGTYHYVMDQKGVVSIRSVEGAKGRLVIPERIGDGVVTSLASEGWMFYTDDAVTELVLPDTVEEWHGYCFSPERICLGKRTRLYLLENTGDVVSLQVPEENPYYRVEDQVLYSRDHSILYKFFDRNAVSYTLHPDTKEIASQAFAGAPALKEVILNEGLLRIGASAFYRLPLTSIRFPESLTYIGGYAFLRVPLEGTVTFPAQVAEIGDCAFAGCEHVKEWRILSDRVKIRRRSLGFRFGPYYMDDMYYVYSVKQTRITAGKKSTAYDYAKKNGLQFYTPEGKKLLRYKKVKGYVFDE